MTTDVQTFKFRTYPSDRVIATLDTPEELQEAVAALADAGVDATQLEVLCGVDGVRVLDSSGVNHGLRARIIRTLQFMGEEHELLRKAEETLAAGHFLLAVPAMSAEEKQQVAALLKSKGGYALHYFGRFSIEDL